MFGFLFTLILLYFVYLLVAATVRFYRWRNRARKQMDDMRRAFGGGQNRGSGQGQANPWFNIFFGDYDNETRGPETRRKKIDPEVGEYVKFTETKDTTAPSPRAPYRVEDQVVDIEWEEIE